jgi:hypothetical protein
MKITIRKPVWYLRTISIKKSIVEQQRLKDNEVFEVRITSKPYNTQPYYITPSRIMNLGKDWVVKGVALINFPIDAMETREDV